MVTPRAQKRSGCGSSAPSARRLPDDAPAALRRPLPTCSSSASPGNSGASSSCCCTTENASISVCPRRRGHSVALEDTGGGAASGAADADASGGVIESNQRLAATLGSPSQRASSSASAASVGPSPTNERSSSTSADCMQTGRSSARDTQTSPTRPAFGRHGGTCQERAKLATGEGTSGRNRAAFTNYYCCNGPQYVLRCYRGRLGTPNTWRLGNPLSAIRLYLFMTDT